jgi:hypothetical protein
MTPATAFILMFYLWTPSVHAGAAVTFAEFSSQEKCEAAGKAAEAKFSGLMSQALWLCVPK